MTENVEKKKRKKWHKNNVEVFIMAMLGAIFVFIFGYTPMFGILLAFKQADNVLNVLTLCSSPIGRKWVAFITSIGF